MIDQDLLTGIQYAVIEPPDGGASWPSGLWSRDEVLSYLNQRQDRLLKETLIYVKTSADLAVANLTRLIALPTDWMRTVSVVWTGTDGQVRELQRVDSFQVDHADSTLGRTATGMLPLYYMEYDTETLIIEIGPTPSGVQGTLSVLYVPVGVDLTGNGVSLLVPDELETAVKYGALADMLGKDGRGKDAVRSQYCEERYTMAVEAARLILEGWA
jgi:hypothetical protein